MGAEVRYFDPYCPVVRPAREHPQYAAGTTSIQREDIAEAGFDAAGIATAHDCVEHDALTDWVPVVIDTRGICRPADNVAKA